MAEGRTCRINLAALQQRDPYITNILETASQVALYSFSSKMNEWEKTDIEGTLFVYTRSAVPINGFMILNRLGMNNQIEPITKDLEFQLQDPFLLYKNTNAIYGIWFYDKDECARIGQLMNSLVQVTLDSDKQNKSEPNNRDRYRRASESDTMFERRSAESSSSKGQIDIMQLLSRAQDEYDKTKGRSSPKKHDPKPFIDNPNASSNNLVKPTAIKPDQDMNGMKVGYSAKSSSTHVVSSINLETLFGRAVSKPDNPELHLGGGDSDPVPLLPVSAAQQSVLDKIMTTHPGNTLAEIERKQRSEIDGKEIAPSPKRDLLGGGGDNEPVYAKVNKKALSQSPNGSDEGQKAINQLLSNQFWTNSVKPESLLTPADLNSVSTSNSSNAQPVPVSLAMLVSGVCQPPPSPKKRSSPPPAGVLMSPMAFEKSTNGGRHQSPLPSIQPPRPDSMLLAFDPIPPQMGGAAAALSPYGAVSSSLSADSSASKPDIKPLTLEQLQQSFIYLLKNDSDFMKKIHEAYIKSLGLP